MAKEPVIFASNQSLKTWCLALADACGGRKVMPVGKMLKANDIAKIAMLIDEFAKEHNEMQKVVAQIEEEADNAKKEEE